jgi:fibronectin type 3 domain-containing protein
MIQKKIFFLVLSVLLLGHFTGCGGGAEEKRGFVNLIWDAPITNEDGSTLNDLAGYNVYYGTASENYSQSIDAGNTTTYTVANLADGLTYYFAVTAYDISGNESEYSNEVSKTID